jgi:amino acid adenylation domain-containing protein
MSARQLLSELEELGVRLTTSEGRISVSAPPGVLTAGLRDRLKEHKQELLATLADGLGPFPLTDIQQAYLVGRSAEMPLGGVGCHYYCEFQGAGLDAARLESAWRHVIERHPMLRAVVREDGTQIVLTSVPEWRLRVDDRDPLAIREEMAHASFDPSRWPLFDIRLSAQGVHFGFDLLAADAAGIRRLFQDWREFYESPDHPLDAPVFTFREHVLAARAEERTADFADDLKYWTERLSHLPGPPELPLARAPEKVTRPRFERRTEVFAPDEWRRLQATAAEWQVTPSILICAAFAETLGRWSRQPRMTLTLTRFASHPEARDVVGDFTSTVLLECAGRGATLRERAAELQRRLAVDLEHARVSGVRALRSAAGAAPSYGFPVVFTSALGHRGGDALSWLGEAVYTLTETPQVWLDHVVVEDAGRLVLSWDAVDELFPPGLLDEMFAAECRLLRSLEGGEWVFSTAQIAERASWNATADPMTRGLLYDGIAAAPRDRIAVIDAERTITFGELEDQARRLAHRLLRDGVQPGDRVAILLSKGWRQVVAVLGALYAGGVYVPIDPETPPARVARLLERVEPAVVLDALEWDDTGEMLADFVERAQHDAAYIIFTSGSTGEPKGVVIDHRGARNTIDDVNARIGAGPNDRVLSLSGLHFDLSVWDIFGILSAGGAVVLPDPRRGADPEHWLDLVARHKVTIWNTVPALLRMVAHGRLDSLRAVMLSGDWIPPALVEEARVAAPAARLIGMGGATEASIWSIWHDVGELDPEWPSIPYGRPMRNQSFHVLDGEMSPCPVWTPGQLYIGGIGLAQGYWRDPERTAAQFVTHPRTGERLYATGDLGRYRPGGVIEFLGREDQQVKIQGHRIELGEVEAAMVRHPQVERAVAVAKGQTFGPRRLVAYAVAAPCWSPEPDPEITMDRGARVERRLALHRREDSAEIALPEIAGTGPARRSVRRFAQEPVSREGLAALLACLRPVGRDASGLPRYRYASAGHLYQVGAYVHCAGVEGLSGFYRYAAGAHGLSAVAGGSPARWHAAENAGMAAEAAFSIYLVADVAAVRAFYGAMAREFCLLEAGYIGQALMIEAEARGLGLCAIGAMDTAAAATALRLGPGLEIVHSFVGGIPLEAPAHEPATPASLRAFLQGELPGYMVPSSIVMLDELPLTANGKVNRAALPDPAAAVVEAPADEAVAWLADLVKEVLGGAPVDPRANFFEIGATSLHLVQLARRLEAAGKRVAITDLFRSPSVNELARHLDRGADSVRDEALARGRERRAARRGKAE